MKKTILILFSVISISIHSAIEILDRVAVIVDDGLITQSQINSDLDEMVQRYEEQNIPKPDIKVLRNQVIESLIIEELQLQLAERYGIRVSDEELNATITRIAANNNLSLEEFIIYLQNEGESYEDFREDVKKQITIQRIQRGRVGSEIDITEKEFEAFLKTDESLIQLEPELLVRQILISKYEDATLIFEKPWMLNPSTDSIISVIYLGIFPTGIAWLLRFRILKTNGLIFHSQVSYIIPIFGIIFGRI